MKTLRLPTLFSLLVIGSAAKLLDVGLRGNNHTTIPNDPRLHLMGFPDIDSGRFPLDQCLGHCNSDTDCKGDLGCFHRKSFEEVPGCIGKGGEGRSYCYDTSITPSPTGSPTLSPTRSELIVLDNIQGPLGKCEGICQNDNDCKGHLMCQKRSGYEYVPGCNGSTKAGANICYDQENDGPAPPQLPEGPFKLRLYWEKGYYWQESPKEMFWCMRENGGGRAPTLAECKRSSSNLEFVYAEGSGDMIKVAGKDLCLDLSSSRVTTFKRCDENRIQQRWQGRWSSQRFDIRSYTEKCLSNHHHPKNGEELYVWDCTIAHRTTTGYWNVYGDKNK